MVIHAMNALEGAYSLILMSSAKMIAVRDPYGFRPLCYGKMPGRLLVIASESCALTAVGAELFGICSPEKMWYSVSRAINHAGDTVVSKTENLYF